MGSAVDKRRKIYSLDSVAASRRDDVHFVPLFSAFLLPDVLPQLFR